MLAEIRIWVACAGNNATYGTCTILAEVLCNGNNGLHCLVLHHNALSQQGLRVLLKACIGQDGVTLALQRASFARAEKAALPMHLDTVNPDGRYAFDLGAPAQRQMAMDLLQCAALAVPC